MLVKVDISAALSVYAFFHGSPWFRSVPGASPCNVRGYYSSHSAQSGVSTNVPTKVG